MFLHGLENLLNGVAGEEDEVEEHQWPEDIDLHHFKIGAGQSQQEGKSCTFPHLHLPQGASQWLISCMFQSNAALIFSRMLIKLFCKGASIKTFGLIVCLRVVFLFGDALGCEISDQ